jgi:hypothetical protein
MKVKIVDERRIDYSNIDIQLTTSDIANLLRFGSVSTIFDRRITITLNKNEGDEE